VAFGHFFKRPRQKDCLNKIYRIKGWTGFNLRPSGNLLTPSARKNKNKICVNLRNLRTKNRINSWKFVGFFFLIQGEFLVPGRDIPSKRVGRIPWVTMLVMNRPLLAEGFLRKWDLQIEAGPIVRQYPGPGHSHLLQR
jgi:hypothetical protein